MRIDRDGVFLRARSYSPWFPTFVEPGADAAPVEFRRVKVSVPAAFTAVFAGELVSRSREAASAVSVWKAASLDLFSAQLTARPFDERREQGVHVYSLRDDPSRAAADAVVDLTRKLIAFYRAHYSPDAVPAQLHIIETPKFGDISSANVVGVQEESWRKFAEERFSKMTLAHELVHPFVKTETPRSDPFYALAIEGFPAYFHYPAMATWEGEEWYDAAMRRIGQRYIEKKRSGVNFRGDPLPPEKPLLEITADEVGKYKDQFLLADRALLMLDDLRRRMGKERFGGFTRELFGGHVVDAASFRAVVLRYLPEDGDRLRVWMETTEYPAGMHIADP
jgi:hypothetical protein